MKPFGKKTYLALFVGLTVSLSVGAGETPTPSRIWSDFFDGWDIEPFCGTSSSALPAAFFQQGPRLEAGGGGSPVITKDGTVIVGAGTFLYRVAPQGRVELLAGTPGVSGVRDGSAEQALFSGICLLALGPKEEIYVLEQGAGRLRILEPQAAGPWRVKTLAGATGLGKRNDGPAENATFEKPCGMTVFDDGRIFIMDNSWLRVLHDGTVTTLNPKGGFGHPTWKDDEPDKPPTEPLDSARFRILFTSNCLTSDGKNLLYVSDMWNNVLRKIDLEKNEVSIINGGPPRHKPGSGMPKGSADRFRDGPGMEMRFHPGGGVTTALFERQTGNIYMGIADDKPHIRTPEGWVRTLKDNVGLPLAFDAAGRVYAGSGDGLKRLRKLKPGEQPWHPEKPPTDDAQLFQRAPFDPNSIPKDVGRFIIPVPVKVPVIDGNLDDECWKATATQVLKRANGSDADTDTLTEVFFAADKNEFFFAMRCREPGMAQMNVGARNRDDGGFHLEDYVDFFLISSPDPRDSVHQVMINNAGQTWEGINKNAKAWNPELRLKAARSEGEWTVEGALPLNSLKTDSQNGVWRMNFGRFRPKRGGARERETTWSVLYSNDSHHYERFNLVALEALGAKLP
jgi:hypothetical protein